MKESLAFSSPIWPSCKYFVFDLPSIFHVAVFLWQSGLFPLVSLIAVSLVSNNCEHQEDLPREGSSGKIAF